MALDIGGAAGGGIALQQVLQDLFTKAIAQKKLAEDARQANMRNAVERGGLELGNKRLEQEGGQFDRKIGEDARQFDIGSGQRDRTIALDEQMQPVRMANVQAQTGDILRKPTAEQEQRDFTMGRDKAQHGYQMSEIGAQGANALRVANVRHTDPTAGPTQQQVNEVADSIALIDQIAKDPSLKNAIGPIDQYGGGVINADPTGVNRFRALHNQLTGKLSLAQAGKLKGQGQISDKERAMLAAAATALSQGMSEKDYLAELAKVRDQFVRMQPGAPVQPAAPGGGAAVEYDFVPGKGLVPRKGGS